MTLKIADRVKETSTTAGTGTLNLAGAAIGFQTFVAGVGNGNTCFYAISHQTASEWEVGIGTVTDASPDTLARTTVLQSSNSDNAVNFAAGTKDVFVTYPAGKAVYKDATGKVGIGTESPSYTLDVREARAGYDSWVQSSGVRVGPSGTVLLDADLSRSITVKAPDVVSTSFTLPLPSGIGSNGQVLTTDSKNTYWSTVSGGSSRSVSGDNDNGIITWVAGDDTFVSEANVTYDGSTFLVNDDLTVGVAGTGHDAIFYGDTSGKHLIWDQSAMELGLIGASKLMFHNLNGGENIVASASGHLEINAGTTLDITAPAVDINVPIGVAGGKLNVDGLIEASGMTVGASGITVTGDLNVGEYIYHDGDANTYIRFQDDSINMYAGNRAMIKLDEGSADKVIINNGTQDVDLQVKGDTDSNLIRTDAANDRVGIGMSSPSYRLDVSGDVRASGVRVGGSGSGVLVKAQETFGDYTLILPSGNGTNGQVLTTDSKNTYWAVPDHDALTNFVANEHIDWTTDQGSTNIHAGNYASGASDIDDLGDVSYGGANLTYTLLLNNAPGSAPTTGTLGSDCSYNLAIGENALNSITDATYNAALGRNALTALTTGDNNIAIGENTGYKETTGQENVYLGVSVGFNHVASSGNIGIGQAVMYGNSSPQAGQADYNVGIGKSCLYDILTGGSNIAIGKSAGYSVNKGSHNVVLGTAAGYGVATGSGNVLLGRHAGYGIHGNRNIVIGWKAGYQQTADDTLIIANESINSSGTLIKGDMYGKYVAMGEGDGLHSHVNAPTLQVYPSGNRPSSASITPYNGYAVYANGSIAAGGPDAWVQASGVNVGASGIVLKDADLSHEITVKAPDVVSTSFTLPLPSGIGTNGQVLTSDSKQTYWSTVSGGGGGGDVEAGSTFTTAGVIMACDGDDKTIDEPGATLTTNGQAMTVSASAAVPFIANAGARDGNVSFEFIGGTGATNHNATLKIIGNTGGNSYLYMGDPDSASIGHIRYKNTDNSMIFHVNGSNAITIASTLIATFANGFEVGSDAAGDILYHNGTKYVRLPKGSDSQVLTLMSGQPSWQDSGGMP